MKSIRFSIIVYFLLLLALALGAISVLVFRTTGKALLAKQATNRELLQTQFKERTREELSRLDNELLSQARILASAAQSQYQGHRLYGAELPPMGLLAASLMPNSHVAASANIAMQLSPTSFRLHRSTLTRIKLDEELLRRHIDGPVEHFQINTEWGNVCRSQSLATETLPFDLAQFRAMPILEWKHDDVTLVSGVVLRRVILKAPISRFQLVRFGPPPSGIWPSESSRFDSTRGPDTRKRGMGAAVAPMRPVDSMVPNMLIQSVSRTDDRNAAIARLDANLAGELDELETEYQETLSDLRMSLIWLNLGTFGATFLGGSLLIGKRLSPLQRLSDAVSRVNEQNFDLSFDDTHLPRELVPIVARLRVTLSQLQSAFEREKRATADISHELRTPLAGLRTSLEVSLKRPRTPESYRETIKECIDIVGQLSQLVERLLTLAHLDAKTDAVHVESVDMASLAHQVGLVMKPLARASEIEFQVDCHGPCQLSTDPDKVREVVTNLVHNAVSYNRPGGKVQLVVEPAEAGMAISVSDTGQGIAPENLDRIFERFFRADPSRHDVGIHAGLGLSIVRAYVEQLGGRISVESEFGKGSRFRVWLPELPLSHSYTDVVSDSELLRSSR